MLSDLINEWYKWKNKGYFGDGELKQIKGKLYIVHKETNKLEHISRNALIHWIAMAENDYLYGKKERRNPVRKYGSKARYLHKRLQDPGRFDKKSFRTIDVGRKRKMIVACPSGKYRAGRCSTGMQGQALLTLKNPKIHYWDTAECKYCGKEGGKLFVKKCPKCSYNVAICEQCLTKDRKAGSYWEIRKHYLDKHIRKNIGGSMLSPYERRMRMRLRRRNISEGFYDRTGFHPIRSAPDYDPGIAGETPGTRRRRVKSRGKRKGFMRKLFGKKRKRNIPIVINPTSLVEIYPRVDEIYATKTHGANKAKYRHPFGEHGHKKPKAFGITSGKYKGSILITTKSK